MCQEANSVGRVGGQGGLGIGQTEGPLKPKSISTTWGGREPPATTAAWFGGCPRKNTKGMRIAGTSGGKAVPTSLRVLGMLIV